MSEEERPARFSENSRMEAPRLEALREAESYRRGDSSRSTSARQSDYERDEPGPSSRRRRDDSHAEKQRLDYEDDEDRRRRKETKRHDRHDRRSEDDDEARVARRHRNNRRESDKDRESRLTRGNDGDRRDRHWGEGRDSRRERDIERRRSDKRHRNDGSRSPSPSDRQKRKAAKAEARLKAKRDQELDQARAIAELSMYTGADNPFHDVNIGERFVWKKKQEKEKKAGLSLDDIARKDARRRLEAKEELDKLNKKRADREAERSLREVEDAKMARMAEDAQMRDWVSKEDDFQLEQSRRRAGIRLREQRAKAIDFLAINLRFADAQSLGRHTAAIGAVANPRRYEAEREEEAEGWGWADAGFEFEIDEPWKIFENLNLDDCIELEEDIRMYLSLEKSPINVEFWEAMLVVCEHHLAELNDPEHAEGGRLFNQDVHESAGRIVGGLSHQRLVELENKTNAMLRSGQPVDGEFWDLVLKKIHVEKAIAKLNSIHEVVLKNRLEQFKKRQREDASRATETASRSEIKAQNTYGGDVHADAGYEGDDDVPQDAEEELDEDDWVEEYDPAMSPPAVDVRNMTLDDRRLPVVEEGDHLRAIFAARRALVASLKANASSAPAQVITHTNQSVNRPSAADLEAERLTRQEAQHEDALHTDESEEEFGDLEDTLDLNAPPPVPLDWSDRYRPRKPRYFNRVLTGFEWTRYNQTHYDTENPPPKTVQGYKFNIFYPDLIDKSKAPTYRTKRIPADEDTQMIIFTAGPPYEDIAFRIVRRPWQYSHRLGFRSTFDRGVLQLYFNFGRDFYRK